MNKVVSTELLQSQRVMHGSLGDVPHSQRDRTGPYGSGVVDLETESWAKYAQLEFRGPDAVSYVARVRLEARTWDSDTWITLGEMDAPMDHQSHYLNVELRPDLELLRYNVSALDTGLYVKLTLSDEENENE